MKELGLAPQTGFLQYTIPTIYDPNTKRFVTESFAIAKYLDEIYPDTPRLVAPGTAGLQEAYLEKVVSPLMGTMMMVLAYPAYLQSCMDEVDKEYVRKKGETLFGKQPEELELKGEALTSVCESFQALLDAIAKHVATNGADAIFITGDSLSHVDTAVASVLVCALKILGKEHELSKVILEHGWVGRYLEAMSRWY